MGKLVSAIVLGVVLFGMVMWFLGDSGTIPTGPIGSDGQAVEPEIRLGAFLYEGTPFPEIKAPTNGRPIDPMVFYGHLTAIEQQEVPSQVSGQILFIGEEIP